MESNRRIDKESRRDGRHRLAQYQHFPGELCAVGGDAIEVLTAGEKIPAGVTSIEDDRGTTRGRMLDVEVTHFLSSDIIDIDGDSRVMFKNDVETCGL